MKKTLKIIVCVFVAVVVAVLAVFSPYLFSFINHSDVVEGKAMLKEPVEIKVSDGKLVDNVIEFTDANSGWFNYYSIEYTSDCYIKGTLSYSAGLKEKTEEFFLEPSSKERAVFYSFVDNALKGGRGNKIKSITFEMLTDSKEGLTVYGISTFNREIPEQEIYIQSEEYKLGVDLLWGGALSYLEDFDSNVEAVSVDGIIKVDSNASERYKTKVVNDSVNLINRNDTGRLVQQSYYGTMDYDNGIYMDTEWHYNPVQGGNQFNDASKIVDLRVSQDSIYIKCRPLDWAKEKEFAAPAYMEATYTFTNEAVKAECRFVDFSGYPENYREQEIPAFYCIEPFNNFIYYKGDKPWTGEALTSEPDLIFWPDAGYPKFSSQENWAAFTGEFEDSFGIGIYVPDQTQFLAGIFNREQTTNEDPSRDGPTSYIAVIKEMTFKSYSPFEYEFYLATGSSEEIREAFNGVRS